MEGCCRKQLEPLVAKHRGKPGQLIPVLHEIQNKIGYLPVEVQEYVARELGVPFSRVYGVVTFYSLFTTKPQGKHSIGICMGTACYVQGAEEIGEELKAQLGIEMGETTADGLFTLTITRCVGCCSMAPVVTIDGQVYGKLTPGQLAGILADYRGRGNDG
ncbi:MAG: NADH-quinone oxidoreductase subunit NuoE [Limnochordia bacterium]|jgi:NADH:ubiquinone oxidoreductase subunit E